MVGELVCDELVPQGQLLAGEPQHDPVPGAEVVQVAGVVHLLVQLHVVYLNLIKNESLIYTFIQFYTLGKSIKIKLVKILANVKWGLGRCKTLVIFIFKNVIINFLKTITFYQKKQQDF